MFSSKKIPAADEAAAYRSGLSWEASIEQLRQKSERNAWWVAGAACVIAACSVAGIATLAPLRRVVPYLYMVDKARGNLEYVGAVDDRSIKGYQELLDKHWAQVYINARESYHYTLLQSDYDTVMALSDENVGRDYARRYDGPNALDKLYGANIEVATSIISLRLAPSSIGTQLVVRFSKTKRHVDTDYREPAEYFVATLRYRYLPSMFDAEKQLLLNPLGYKVADYRVDAEIAPAEAPTAPIAPRTMP
jgi:type IV secretion system protein VirB8